MEGRARPAEESLAYGCPEWEGAALPRGRRSMGSRCKSAGAWKLMTDDLPVVLRVLLRRHIDPDGELSGADAGRREQLLLLEPFDPAALLAGTSVLIFAHPRPEGIARRLAGEDVDRKHAEIAVGPEDLAELPRRQGGHLLVERDRPRGQHEIGWTGGAER